MLRFIYFTRAQLVMTLVMPVVLFGCRKKIDFDQESSSESGNLHPLQQYYEPWETISVSTKGTPYMIESDGTFLYIVSDAGDRRWVEFTNATHIVNTLFYSADYQFTALDKGVNRMILGASGGQQGVATFDYGGIINTYGFHIQPNWRINSFYDDAISFYIGGFFGDIPLPSYPNSTYADRLYANNGLIAGCDGVYREVYEMDRVYFSPYACGNGILSSDHSIGEWNGTTWEPRTPIIGEKVTAIEELNDTLFIAGFDANEFAIRKFANGNLITDSTIINTAPSLSESDVKMISHNGALYVYGTANFPERIYTGVLKYFNGQWSYVGKLGSVPDDVAIFNGYLYALTNGQLKRFPL